MNKVIFVLVLSIIFLFGCTGGTPPNDTNDTGQQSQVAQYGDTVIVDYTLTVDGEIADSTLDGQPFTFTLLRNSGVINGFVNGILGMEVGSTKTIVVPNGYGQVDPTKIYRVNRSYEFNRTEVVSLESLREIKPDVEEGQVIGTEPIPIYVDTIVNDTATIYYWMEENDTIVFNGFPQKVVSLTETTAILRLEIESGTYAYQDPMTGQVKTMIIRDVTDDTITVDENHPLVGKTLTFNVTLLNIVSSPSGSGG